MIGYARNCSHIRDAAMNVPAQPAQPGIGQLTHEVLTLVAIRQYFTNLRREKGHCPDASPIDLELLLIVKFIMASGGDAVDLLRRVGIILIDDKIVINVAILTDSMVSSRSRINSTLNRLKWNVVELRSEDKWNVLKPLLERPDLRNWTIRVIPPHTALYMYVQDNAHVKFRNDGSLVFVPISLDPTECI
jgi:hypothetical protein